MNSDPKHYRDVAAQYDQLARHGVYATLAPHNRGARKSEYVAAVFDAALFPLLAAGRYKALLDFGCGTGIFARQAATIAGKVTGVEISSGILAVAAEVCAGLPNVDLLLIDGERLPFDNASFDCIVARETLCYVPEARFEAVLTEFLRVLRPGGRLLIIDQVSEVPHWQHHPASPRQIRRTPAAIRIGAAHAGFVLVDQYPVRTPRFPIIYLAWGRLIPRAFIPALARLEVRCHRLWPLSARRWWDELFLFGKPT